jgi:polyphosphate kinase
MPRNLERRLELMTPICDNTLSHKLYEILQLQLSDSLLSWKLQNNGEYKKVKLDKELNSQHILEVYTNKVFKMLNKNREKNAINKLAHKMFKES